MAEKEKPLEGAEEEKQIHVDECKLSLRGSRQGGQLVVYMDLQYGRGNPRTLYMARTNKVDGGYALEERFGATRKHTYESFGVATRKGEAEERVKQRAASRVEGVVRDLSVKVTSNLG